MNRFELICKYCGNSWEINYTPQEEVRCAQCKDTAIKVIDNYRDKIDQYVGCPDFPDKQEKWNI
jgi:hypothetical protein